MKVKMLEENFVEMCVGTIKIYTFPMSVKDLIKISYVAVRGRDKEEGAVKVDEDISEKRYLFLW